MRRLVFLIFTLLSHPLLGQTAADSDLAGQPLEITASGGTSYNDGIARARDNVAIHIGETDIYADEADYNMHTKDVHLRGNVRIYRGTPKGTEFYVGEQGVYNTETKKIRASDLRTLNAPFFINTARLSSLNDGGNLVEASSFTTHDSPTPDFRLRARKMRVYEGDRVIMRDVVFYVGRVPIFYWPYVYQSLSESFSFVISPAYLSSWGPSLLSHVSFPITDHVRATARLDLRGRRGVAFGFDADIRYGVDDSSQARVKTYFLQDENRFLNRTSLPRESIPAEQRYRLSLQNRTEFGNGITGLIDITRLSDAHVLEDFFQSEFQVNPQPDNIVVLKKEHPGYALTAWTRFQMNNFFEATERLPEVALDITRQPLFGTGIFYEGESSVANLRRDFADESPYHDYETARFDTFHQLLYPRTYFGWLSVIPRVGFRATYYDETREVDPTLFPPTSDDPLIPDFLIPPPPANMPLARGGDRLRTVLNTGVEASFKASRTWENAQSRALGLDGLRHIVQPFVNFSWVGGNGLDPAEIWQFDRYIPSTQLRPIDFPQFTTIDSLANWSIARVGVRNRLQTRRDDITFNWLELETYFDVNFDNPYDQRDYSNVYNRLRFAPLPWAALGISAQVPLFSNGFTEINTSLHFQPIAPLQVDVSHRFLNENPFFENSSVFAASAYLRIDDHWGVGAYGRYEAITNIVEEQRYSIYRDLTSWVASLGGIIRDNDGVKEYGVLVTFTLKALPKFSFDLNFDPGAQGGNQPGL